MSGDLPNFDVADQLHDDLLVKWLTDSNNTGFANNLEAGTSVDEVPKTTSTWAFLQAR
jgi:muramidase (phage lysozyme)